MKFESNEKQLSIEIRDLIITLVHNNANGFDIVSYKRSVINFVRPILYKTSKRWFICFNVTVWDHRKTIN